jgi:hypothetical protein
MRAAGYNFLTQAGTVDEKLLDLARIEKDPAQEGKRRSMVVAPNAGMREREPAHVGHGASR